MCVWAQTREQFVAKSVIWVNSLRINRFKIAEWLGGNRHEINQGLLWFSKIITFLREIQTKCREKE